MPHSLSLVRRGINLLVVCALLFGNSRIAMAQGYWGGSDGSASTNWGSGSGWNGGGWLGSSGTSKEWKLGVVGNNTEVGVVVTQVSPNSAASRAGIAPRDVIVCVDGDQVGRVAGKIFDLTEELNHHADSNGRVQMLLQSGRTLQLTPKQIQLDDQQSGLTGTLVIRNGSPPPDSIVTVKLENVTRPHFVVRNGENAFRLPSYATGEIPFVLNYDPSYIFPGDSYRVRAYITSRGSTVFDTEQPPFVLTRGYPSNVRLALSPASYTAASVGTYTSVGGVGNGGVVLAAGYANYDAVSQQVTAAYQRYLGRSPTSIELAAWQALPDVNYRMTTMPIELMAAQEYYDRVGNNNAVWLERVFAEIIGRVPTPQELDVWMRRFADLRYSRMDLLRQLKSQSGR